MRRLKLRKKAFTLAETMIVCTIFAMMVIWIILGINRAFAFMNNTKLSVEAANLAREWVEMMYTIRDTNWRKHSWDRDKYWLNLWTWTTQSFSKWIYVLKEEQSGENKNFYAKWITGGITDANIENIYSLEWFFNYIDDATRERETIEDLKLNFDWKYKYYEFDEKTKQRKSEPTEWNIKDDLVWNWLEFYRIVRVFGVYKKNVDNTNDNCCDDTCSKNWTPAEMRFCVKVFYRWNWDFKWNKNDKFYDRNK